MHQDLLLFTLLKATGCVVLLQSFFEALIRTTSSVSLLGQYPQLPVKLAPLLSGFLLADLEQYCFRLAATRFESLAT